MDVNSNRQNQALVILTIGTAILGVVIFQVDFSAGNAFSALWKYVRLSITFPIAEYIAVMKLIVVGIVAVHYFMIFRHVMRIMSQTSYITGRQLVNGPMHHLGVEIWFLMAIFALDVVQKSLSVSYP